MLVLHRIIHAPVFRDVDPARTLYVITSVDAILEIIYHPRNRMSRDKPSKVMHADEDGIRVLRGCHGYDGTRSAADSRNNNKSRARLN